MKSATQSSALRDTSEKFYGNAGENITNEMQSKASVEFVSKAGKPRVSLPTYSHPLKQEFLTMQEINPLPLQRQGKIETLLFTFFGVSLASFSIYLFDTNSFFSLTQFFGFDVETTDKMACVVSIIIGFMLTAYGQRKRRQVADAEKYLYWSQAILRYFLAYIFLLYGFAKVFRQQFYSLPSTLDTPLGDISGLQLTWRFFGYSYAYTLFIAASQIIGSVLLFFRRTTTLAVVILLPVVVNIVFVNFTHSIPVKFYSSTYLLMLLYLLFTDYQRLKALFWDHLPFAGQEPAVFTKKRPLLIAKFLLIFLFFAVAIGDNYQSHVAFSKVTTPLLGVWDVQNYEVNDVPRAANADAAVWTRIYFDADKLVAIKTSKPRPERFLSTLDDDKRTIKLENFGTDELFVEGEYELPSPDKLIIKVANETETIRVTLNKVR
jgi:uncharacterized membrane protein YphA (DoxX/SURF4 family)